MRNLDFNNFKNNWGYEAESFLRNWQSFSGRVGKKKSNSEALRVTFYFERLLGCTKSNNILPQNTILMDVRQAQ